MFIGLFIILKVVLLFHFIILYYIQLYSIIRQQETNFINKVVQLNFKHFKINIFQIMTVVFKSDIFVSQKISNHDIYKKIANCNLIILNVQICNYWKSLNLQGKFSFVHFHRIPIFTRKKILKEILITTFLNFFVTQIVFNHIISYREIF